MDNHSHHQNQDTPVLASSGCCGGKSAAQPKANSEPQPEPRVAETVEREPVRSGCCCGNN